MNEDLYLTKEAKEYYMADFEKVLKYRDSEFWDIDEGLTDILININRNQNIQTIYSKKLNPNEDSFGKIRNSYLLIAYSKNIKHNLLFALQEIVNSRVEEIRINDNPPKANPNRISARLKGIDCIDNPDYFYINHITIELECHDLKAHQLFWMELETKLSQLQV